VEGKLTLSFGAFLLGSEDRVSLSLNTLSEEFLDSLSGEDLLEGRLSFADETETESAETNLNDSSVVEDLGVDVCVTDGILKMRHEEHVAGGVVVVVKGVVVDVGKHGSGSEERVAGLVEVDADSANESDSREFAGGSAGLRLPDGRFVGDGGKRSLESLGDDVGLSSES